MSRCTECDGTGRVERFVDMSSEGCISVPCPSCYESGKITRVHLNGSDFEARCAQLEFANKRLKRIEIAWDEWQDKTEWVQKTARPRELGMHRADVLRLRIEKAEAQRDKVLATAKAVIGSFESLGRASGVVNEVRAKQRCEKEMVAMKATIAEVEGGV